MFKATAVAPANLAFVKYWGKIDPRINLPCNNSISVNLSEAFTTTTVEFDPSYQNDEVVSVNATEKASTKFSARVSAHLNRIRSIANVSFKARVTTENSFPSGVGIASSASGFAALTLAAIGALGLELSNNQISAIARLGSGSACRSIPDGFVEWIAGKDNDTSYAITLAPPNHWRINIVSVVVSQITKKTSSTDGHSLAPMSPFFEKRLDTIEKRLELVRNSIRDKDFQQFGRELEKEAISMHAIAMTSPIETIDGWISGCYYWLPDTLELMLAAQNWRTNGLNTFFTLDAGPTVHFICQDDDLTNLLSNIDILKNKYPLREWRIMINQPSLGARLIPTK